MNILSWSQTICIRGCSLLHVLTLAVMYQWSCELSPPVGFLCSSKLRLHQRCKFVRQWLAKNHDSERTGAALLSVWAHHYLTHSGGPGDWWVGHDSCPTVLLFPPSFCSFFSLLLFSPSFPQWLPNKMTPPGLRNTSDGGMKYPKMQFFSRGVHKYA